MSLETALQSFSTLPLLKACRSLFKDTLKIPLSPLADSPITPQRFFRDAYKPERHDGMENLFLVGRITDDSFHAATQAPADLDTAVAQAAADDYNGMFLIAADLGSSELTRSDLAARTREINRTFSAPVIVVFKHTTVKQAVLSIGVASRRPHKRDNGKDVLGKVSMIREIHLETPHRGHLEILKDFSLAELEKNGGKGKRGHRIDSFKTFHAALEQIFNTDLLNERFYKDLANWYFWALPQVEFPNDLEKDDEKRRATGLIRLLTRLIFCWFLKEKNLIPEKLFHPADLGKILKGFDPESETSSTYYQAILQNLFFATLNQRMGKDGNGKPYRLFATDEGFAKNRATYDVNNLYRYEKLFAGSQDEALAHFADIPFLNGGLFECLDRTEDGTDKKLYLDGFSRNTKKRPHVPDRLFFDSGEIADLSNVYDDKKRKAEKVTGLITILNRYKFTIVENTPIDQEIALDPELLGKVFENLLASYNEETKTTARKQTGSFYTPRPIVDYMVDESLKAHLERKLTTERTENTEQENQNSSCLKSVVKKSPPSDLSPSGLSVSSVVKNSSSSVVRAKLDDLFAYTEKEHTFTPAEVATLITAIDSLKILDPACGSGAFPMGVLHKLVYCLGKLDPDNDRWRQTQLAKLDSAPMREELERAFADNNDDYGRKLYLIENCLYGVDIQPIAIQITKLRFFISLVCDQKTNRNKKENHGIRPLPNLETKFVAANTLIGLPEMDQMELIDPRVYKIEAEIETLYHNHFSIQRRDQKLAVQGKVKALRKEMAELLTHSLMSRKKSEHIAEWDPFDPQSSAEFFDPHWMFGRSLADGFDIVIGNPPYIHGKSGFFTKEEKVYFKANYTTAEYQMDTYVLFTERSVLLNASEGITALIVPNTWLSNTRLIQIRRFLLSHCDFITISQMPPDVFSQAVVDTVILVVKYTKNCTDSIPVNIFNDGQCLSLTLSRADVKANDGAIFETNTNDRGKLLLRKIEACSVEISSIAKINRGVHPYRKDGYGKSKFSNGYQTKQDYVERSYHSNQKLDDSYYPEVRGRHIHPYHLEAHEEFISWGDWLAEPREFSLFKDERIYLRKIVGKTLYACYVKDSIVADQSVYIAVPNNQDYKIKYILGILNSKLLAWFFRNKHNEFDTLFPQIKVTEFKKLPIAKTSKQTPVIEIVDRIIAVKHLNKAAGTTTLELELDQQVYALYGLTPEEIAIVEGTGK